jgi:hypothetical protein
MTVATRPRALAVLFDRVPEVLKALPRWVVWRYVDEVDKETGEVEFNKPPVNARTGNLASSTNPKTWSTFAEAHDAYQRGGLDGIGFVLHRKEGETGGPVGIDLDHCRDPQTGAIEPWAMEIVAALNTYTEVSPSGEGLRLFVFGNLPPEGRKKGNYENYQSGRYVTITGNRLNGTPPTIEHRQAELEAVHRRFWPPKNATHANDNAGRHNGTSADLDDREIISRALAAKNGSKFRSLWEGGVHPHGSHSEADLALVGYLAFWCGPHSEDRIDALFRQSGLFRSKWNREDYRRRTIAKALQERTEFYQPKRPRKQVDGAVHEQVDGAVHEQPERTSGTLPRTEGNGVGQATVGPHAKDIILDHFRTLYLPVFRRGEMIYSQAFGREVRRSEACRGADSELIAKLSKAGNWTKPDCEPRLFTAWAPTAYADLWRSLPDEDASGGEIADAAAEDFRAQVMSALHRLVNLGHVHEHQRGREIHSETRVESRSLLDWCNLWAKAGRWQQIRSYLLWTCREADGRLRVALRPDLFRQVGIGTSSELRSFAKLAELYGVGTSLEGCRPGGQRAVELATEFLAEALDRPGQTESETTETLP